MECLRFGSSIPGGYWGCCAADILQNFNKDPDEKASIQVTNGDGGGGMQGPNGGMAFLGMTYREIFHSRLRIGTFSTRDMPNHAFFIMLTDGQVNSVTGKKWLEEFKKAGFEFVRTVNNSVWNVNNHVFALFRNCGPNAVKDQFTPPKSWTDIKIEDGKLEAWECLSNDTTTEELTKRQAAFDKKAFDALGPAKIYKQEELEAAGVPVLLSAIRTNFPPQGPETRKAAIEAAKKGVTPHYGHQYNTYDPAIKTKVTTAAPAPATEA
jgi:hypothetical protein